MPTQIDFNYNDYIAAHPEYKGMNGTDLGKQIYARNPDMLGGMPLRKFLGQFLLVDKTPKGGAENMPQETTVNNLLIGVGAGFNKFGQGIQQLVSGPDYTKKTDEENALYNKTPVANSTAGEIGKVVGETLPYMAAPVLAPEGLAAKMGANALFGAGIGATQYVPEGGSRIANTIGGAVGGAVVPAALGVASKIGSSVGGEVAKGAKILKTDLAPTAENIRQDLQAKITNPESTIKRANDAKAVGINLTMGQGSGENEVLAAEKAAFATQAGQKAQTAQNNQVLSSVADLKNKIAPPEMAAQVSSLYKQAYSTPVPTEELKLLSSNDIVKNAAANVLKSKEKLDNLGATIATRESVVPTLGFWSEAAKNLGGKITSNINSKDPNLIANNIALKNAQQHIYDTLDALNPSYKVARDLSSRVQAANKIQSKIDAIPIKELANNPGPAIYNSLLKTPTKVNSLIKSTNNIPTDPGVLSIKDHIIKLQSALENINKLPTNQPLPDLIANNANSTLNAHPLTLTARAGYRLVKNLIGKDYDEAMVHATTDPAWSAEMSSILADAKTSTNAMQKYQVMNRLNKLLTTVQATHNDNK